LPQRTTWIKTGQFFLGDNQTASTTKLKATGPNEFQNAHTNSFLISLFIERCLRLKYSNHLMLNVINNLKIIFQTIYPVISKMTSFDIDNPWVIP
jgi:hypothetical protein